MAVKTLTKGSKIGIIRQARAIGAASPYKAIASTNVAWTNPGLAATNYRTVIYNAGSIIPNPDIQIDQYNVTSGSGIHTEYERRFIDATSGLPSISFNGVMDRTTLTPHLVGAFHTVGEGITNTYEKTITAAGLTSPIDFQGNVGYLHTLAFSPNSTLNDDDGIILKNAIINNLNLSFDFNNHGVARLAQVSGTWVGNDMDVDQTLSGTWVTTTLTPFNNTDTYSCTTLLIDSVSYAAECIRRFEFTVNNNVTSNCKTTGGAANQYDITPEYKATIILDWNSATEKLLGDFQAGGAVSLVFTNDIAVETAGHFSITAPYGILMSNPYIYNGDFIGISLDIKFYSNAAATPVTILLDDSLSWSYE